VTAEQGTREPFRSGESAHFHTRGFPDGAFFLALRPLETGLDGSIEGFIGLRLETNERSPPVYVDSEHYEVVPPRARRSLGAT
jgi:hypothetical protein